MLELLHVCWIVLKRAEKSILARFQKVRQPSVMEPGPVVGVCCLGAICPLVAYGVLNVDVVA